MSDLLSLAEQQQILREYLEVFFTKGIKADSERYSAYLQNKGQAVKEDLNKFLKAYAVFPRETIELIGKYVIEEKSKSSSTFLGAITRAAGERNDDKLFDACLDCLKRSGVSIKVVVYFNDTGWSDKIKFIEYKLNSKNQKVIDRCSGFVKRVFEFFKLEE